jgi:6-phosphofructokinase
MNAATRAVVRAAVARGFTVAGIRDDYTGLIATDIHWRVQ